MKHFTQLSHEARHLLVCMNELRGSNGIVRGSIAWLAHESGRDKQTTELCLRELQAALWITPHGDIGWEVL